MHCQFAEKLPTTESVGVICKSDFRQISGDVRGRGRQPAGRFEKNLSFSIGN